MGDYRYNPVDPVHNAHLLAGESSVFDRIGIGVPDADQALEVSGIVHISAEQGTTPDAPANGDGGLLYTKADGKPYWRSNDVSETDLSAAGGGSGDITRVNITAGTGLTGSQNTASGDHTQTLALSHLGIQDLTDPGADRIMFWDENENAVKFLVPNDNLAISGTNLNATDTNTTYSAATSSALGLMKIEDDTEQSVAANAVSATAGRTYGVQFNSSDQAVVNVPWTDSGGISWDGSTANGVATYKDSDEATVESNLTFDGNSLLVITGSASAVPCTIKGAGSQTADLLQVQDSTGDELLVIDKGGSIKLGLGGDREIHVEPQSGSNKAGKDLFLKGGKSTGNTEGGDIRFYTSPVGSSGSSVNNWTEALKIRHDNVVDFKIAAATKTGSTTISTDFMSTAEISPSKWLEIKIAGTQYFLPAFASGQFA